MIRDDERNPLSAVAMYLPAQAPDVGVRIQQVLRRYTPYGQYQLRLDQRNLPSQIGFTCGHLARQGVAVAWRSAFEDIGNEYLITAQTHRPQHGIQELTGAPHEGFTLPIFVTTRRFSDNHPLGVAVPDAKHGPRTARMQFAACAHRHSGLQLLPVKTWLATIG